MKKGNFWPFGKLLGGSSAVNAMLYVRGNRRDYDYWAELGNAGWNWDNVLEYFKKSENNLVDYLAADRKNHGVGGPLIVNNFNSVVAMKMILAECFFELGYKEIFDCNGDEHLGVLTSQVNANNGARWSAAKGFLGQAKNRTNLHVIKHAHVTKLEFKKDGSTVAGVNFLIDETIPMKAFVRKEVILSAGAINTPQILMLSGIGPDKQLKKHNIPVIRKLPVGRNLQDHLFVPVAFTFHKSTAQPHSLTDLADAMYQYVLHGTGMLASTEVTDFIGFFSTVNDPKYPDIQIHTLNCKKQEPMIKTLFTLFGFNDEIIESMVEANAKSEIVIIIATLLNPKSRGSVKLHSADPLAQPKINHNYLLEKEDLETVIKGVQIIRNITNTETYRAHEGEEVIVNLPKCKPFEYDSPEYWECYARHMTSTLYHPSGTAKMGPTSDAEAVVDSTLKVNGVGGLRVIDASIMPKIVSGNTNAPTIMIAEKGADFIKEEWTVVKDEL